jgi:hypothetical protein
MNQGEQIQDGTSRNNKDEKASPVPTLPEKPEYEIADENY